MKILLLSLSIFISTLLWSQTDKTFSHNSLTREYLEYVPAIYDGSEAVPLVLCLHGLGDTKENFFNIGMNYLADTANFIALFPEAIPETQFGLGTAWNSGASASGFVLNPSIDDVDFLIDLIEYTKTLYNIDNQRIYVTGFSMGGFMTNRLACERSNYFAAAASLSGTIGTALTCNPQHPIPLCHFHGTADGTVAYVNNNYGNDAEELVEYWRSHNQCDATPIHTALPDLVSDGKTVDHYLYENGSNESTVEFFKITNGEHDWMYYPVNDFTYTIEIWNFFNKHRNTNVGVKNIEKPSFVYPNPANNYIYVANQSGNKQAMIEIFDISGQKINSYKPEKWPFFVDLSSYQKGIYIFKNGHETVKLVIE